MTHMNEVMFGHKMTINMRKSNKIYKSKQQKNDYNCAKNQTTRSL